MSIMPLTAKKRFWIWQIVIDVTDVRMIPYVSWVSMQRFDFSVCAPLDQTPPSDQTFALSTSE